MCKIGQDSRCKSTGCEWKKAFGDKCSSEIWSPKFVPAEINSKSFRAKRKGRFVKEKTNTPVVKKEKEIDFNKIGIASQDDWIKKIKSV